MPVSKQRLERKSNKPHHESGQQELLHPVKIAPINVRFKTGLKATAYWLKCGIAIELNETVYCHRLDSLLYYFLDT